MQVSLIIAAFLTVFAVQSQTQDYLAKIKYYTFKNQDSVYYYSQKIIDKVSIENEWEDMIVMRFKNCKTALFFYNIKRLDENLKHLDSLYIKYKNEIENSPQKITFYNRYSYNKGFYNYRLNNYSESISQFNDIIKRSEHLPDSLLSISNRSYISIAYGTIAKIYTNERKYKQAIEYYNASIRFSEIRNKGNKDLLYSIYNLLAEVLQKQKKYKTSNFYLLKTIKYHEDIGSRNSVTTSAYSIIRNYINLRKIDSARFYFDFVKNYISPQNKFYPQLLDVKSKILSSEGNYEEALNELEESLRLTKKQFDNAKRPEIAEIYNKIALLNIKLNQSKRAIENYNLAIDQFSEDIVNSTTNQTVLFKILKNKSVALNVLEDYGNSTKVINQAVNLLDSLKPTFKNYVDKLFLIEDAYPMFENGIEAVYNLYRDTKNKEYIDTAFYYSEKSKSTLLLEILLSSKAKDFSGIPSNLTEKERQLKSQITQLKKRINEKSSDALQDELFDLKQEYRNLILDFETNYKNYYNLKYNTQVLSANKLQKSLGDEDIVLSYFYGNNAIYIITITKDSKNIEQIKLDDNFETLLKDSYTLLSDPESDILSLNTKMYALYNTILKPGLAGTSKQHLIIFADGLLNYLPFGSLSTSDTDLKYLIEDYTISYSNSATLLMQLQSRKQNNKELLAFAPNFENSYNTHLLPLPNNKKEVENILKYFKGRSFTNEQASLQNFNKYNSDYSIIHLATHAIFKSDSLEYSYLAFTPDSGNDDVLYISDLYNLELDADLITISACETGVGILKRGEGLLSLAHGFYFSGASSISSTLWKIPDASSSELMNTFYSNLSKGYSKSKALQQAKIVFLNTNRQNALSHPYYWSGFIISGNTKPLVSNNQWFWIIITVAILGILFLLLKPTKNKS